MNDLNEQLITIKQPLLYKNFIPVSIAFAVLHFFTEFLLETGTPHAIYFMSFHLFLVIIYSIYVSFTFYRLLYRAIILVSMYVCIAMLLFHQSRDLLETIPTINQWPLLSSQSRIGETIADSAIVIAVIAAFASCYYFVRELDTIRLRLIEQSENRKQEFEIRKRLEDDRLRMEDQLHQAQKTEALAKLAGGVAHNLNNLLTGIIGNIELAKTSPSDQVDTYLHHAVESSNVAAQLVKELLEYCQESELRFRNVSLNQLLYEVYSFVQNADDCEFDIQLDLDSSNPQIQADPYKLKEIFITLCTNARDALIQKRKEEDSYDMASTDSLRMCISSRVIHSNDLLKKLFGKRLEKNQKGSEFSHRTQQTIRQDHEIDAIRLSDASQDSLSIDFIEIEIEDNGVGIEEADKPRIFEPFYSTKKTVGAGLGLASAYGIIQQHGGWIDFTSVKKQGSTFCVYLPVETNSNS